ncbi:MAG: hypothetical protein WDA21_01725 [Bacilli bacterium]
MKKLLIFFILLLMPNTIYAEEIYYSNYSDFSPWQETPIESNELTNVEIETRYHWYKNIRVNDNYYIEGLNNSLFVHKDNDDYIETNWSEWDIIYPGEVLNRTIEKEAIYRYRYMKDIRYIHIYDVYGSYDAFRIPEIKIYSDSYKIDYNTTCTGCSSTFSSYIKNNKINENKSYINNGGYLIIDLKNNYSIDSLKIDLYLYDRGTNKKKFKIALTKNKSTTSKQYMYKNIALNFKSKELEPNHYSYTMNESWIKEPEWDAYKITKKEILPTYYRQVITCPEYRYKDKLYMYYKLEKEYIDGYLFEAPDLNYLKDEEDKIKYYRYQTREKVVLPDNIVITIKDYNLLDYIDTAFTKDNINVNHNININTNGTYQVNYILPFDNLVITKEVVVDIEENKINDVVEDQNKSENTIEQPKEKTDELSDNDSKEEGEKIKLVFDDNKPIKVIDKKRSPINIEETNKLKENNILTNPNKESLIVYHKKEDNKKPFILSLNLYLYIYIIVGIIVLIILFRKFFIRY